jgi:putative phosphoribosyl transferase
LQGQPGHQTWRVSPVRKTQRASFLGGEIAIDLNQWDEREMDADLLSNRTYTAMPFKDRADAGRRLAKALEKYRNKKPLILALPRGGVPVASEIASALNAPLDLILVRKIGVPREPELAMGAVVDGGTPTTVRNDDVIQMAGVNDADFKAVCDSELAEIERRRQRYLGTRERVDVTGRTAIVVDDGIATGATMRAALQATRMRKPKKLVLAVPVAPTETVAALRWDADDVICLEEHEFFGAIGFYYRDFSQVSDEEVIKLLGESAARDRSGFRQGVA